MFVAFFRFLARQPGNFMLSYELELSAKRHNDRFCLIRSLVGIAMNPISAMRVICLWERFRKFQIWLTSSNLTKWPNFRIFLESAAWKGHFFFLFILVAISVCLYLLSSTIQLKILHRVHSKIFILFVKFEKDITPIYSGVSSNPLFFHTFWQFCIRFILFDFRLNLSIISLDISFLKIILL